MKSQSFRVATMIVMLTSLLVSCSTSRWKKHHHKAIVYPPDDFHHPPLVNLSLFRYHINSHICQEDDTPIKVVIMVKSHVGNQQKRHLIRTAYSAAKLKALGIRRVFVLAMLHNNKENNKLYKSITRRQIRGEKRTYADIIQINYFERYDFLTYKTLMGMKWVVTNCNSSFLVTQDDDVVVDVYQLLTRISSLKGEDKNSMYGKMLRRWNVSRNGSWSVTREQLAQNVYPDFLTGFFQYWSLDTTKFLLDNAEKFVYLNTDDALISGLIAEKFGVKRIGIDGLSLNGRSPNCCQDKKSGVMFQCKFMAVEIKKPPSLQKVNNWRQHMEKCFKSNQCKPFQESRNLTDLICV